MKKYQSTLLAGVAALALVAGTGLASAQQSKGHMGGSQAGGPQTGQSMSHQSMNKGSQTQAQQNTKGTESQAQLKGKGTETQAQEKGKINTNRTAQTGKENMKPSGQESQKMGRRNARAEHMNRGSKSSRQAERQRTLKGLQGNASKPVQGENQQGANSNNKGNTSKQAQQQTPQNNNMQRGAENNQGGARVNGSAEVQGANVRLSEHQRTQIRETVINGRHAPRVGHVDFDVRVGTVIPRGRIHVVPVPQTLVRIEPRWRGFLYFVYEDEVVIVNPHNMHIVAIVPA
jgi:hypothetical protein